MSTPLYRSRPGGAEIRPAAQSKATRIRDFIWLSEGLSNSYLVVTPEGRVVINTGMGFEAPVHKQVFDAVDTGPLRYILLTQGHVDHVGGVDQLREPGTEIVAQANNAACQADDARIARFRAKRSAFAFGHAIAAAARQARTRPDSGAAPVQSKPEPTVTFDDRYDFELGGTRFELISTPGGETIDSMIVWLPEHRIAFVGNLFSALFGHFPNLVTIRGDRYRFAIPFLESLDRVLELEPELLLSGHFGPVEGRATIARELRRLRGAVEYVHDETVRGMNEGRDLYTLMRELRLPPELEVGEGYGRVSWSVRAIWEGYAGWFHHRSSTELYPVPYWSVHGDLVELAGGTTAIVERARERLEAGEPVEALHLCEVALAHDAADRGALEASSAAHEALLEHSGGRNFWEVAWLEKELERLRGLLGTG